jgi:streptogramin lyase
MMAVCLIAAVMAAGSQAEPTLADMTPSAQMTEFYLGISSFYNVWDIASGPDGNLWFTETPCGFCGGSGPPKIGRITPTGVVTEFSAGITGKGFGDITAGPDGALWFTEPSSLSGPSDRIGRITPTGTVTEFSHGITPGSHPYGITTGPDKNLWFTEMDGHRIGRITPDGMVTEFPLSAGNGPTGIAAGPDGNLWFTWPHGPRVGVDLDRIGRITADGTITSSRPASAPSAG